jgi:hypothetical protein
MKLDANCDECIRLWRDYLKTATDHIRLQGNWQLAMLQRDYIKAEDLLADVNNAQEQRNASREAINEHEACTHSKVALSS